MPVMKAPMYTTTIPAWLATNIAVPAVTAMPRNMKNSPIARQIKARLFIQLLLRYVVLLQWGHLATSAFRGHRMERAQHPHTTRTRSAVSCGRTGIAPTPITRLQFSLGQMTLVAVREHVRRQLHGQRTYFLPGGGEATGVAS